MNISCPPLFASAARIRLALLFLLTQILSVLVVTIEIWGQPGWPANHEINAFALRAVYTAEEFRAGNFFSIWSIHENFGMGSPLALYYPRLFSMVAAFGIVAGFTVKSALVGAVLFFGVLGGCGLYGALRELQLPRPACWILSLCFVHLNYAKTDLIERGAMAEYSLLMLLPFLAWWALRLIRRGEFSYWIIPLWTALYFAHTTLMAYAIPIPLTAGVIALIRCRRQCRTIIIRALIAGGGITMLLLPYFLLCHAQRKFFLFEIGYLRFLNPRYFFLSLAEQFPRSLLFPSLFPINPWVTPGILIAMVAAGAILGCLCIRHRAELSREIRKRWQFAVLILLPFCWFFFLQHRVSRSIYLTSDFFIVLQFPWRLQSFTTILMVLCFGLLLKFLHGKIAMRWLLTLSAIPLLLGIVSSVGTPLVYPRDRVATELIESPTSINWLEYIPILPKFRDKIDSDEFRRRTTGWVKDYAGRPPLIEGPPPRRLEYRELPLGVLELTSEADQPYVLVTRSAWSNLALVTLDTPGENARLSTWRTREDPRLRFAVPAGVHTLTIRPPSLGNYLRRAMLPVRPVELPENSRP